MTDLDLLRRRLQLLYDSTATGDEVEVPGGWIDDDPKSRRVRKSDVFDGLPRQVRDDGLSGRVSWRGARQKARFGLQALDRGEAEMAEIWLWEGMSLRMAALESQMRPEQWADLGTSAKRRGPRARNADQDSLIAEAMAVQGARGLTGKAALRAALAENPDLAAMCRDRTDDAILAALRRRK